MEDVCPPMWAHPKEILRELTSFSWRMDEINLLVHDEDTPGDGPLLNTNKSTTFRRRGQFTDIDGDLGRFNSNRQTVDDAPNDQHADVLGGTTEGRSY